MISPEQNQLIRLMVADDHHVVRRGLVSLLNEEPDFQIVAEADNGRRAVEMFARERPDVTLLDLRMPVLDGIGAINEIRALDPRARLILLTTFDVDEGVYNAMRAGAKAYMLKDATPEELSGCIRQVAAGQTCLPPAMAARLAKRMSAPELTTREIEVLRLLARGKSNKEIGAQLYVSEGTVKTHMANIMSKLNAASRTEAIATAVRRGLIEL